MFSFKALKFFPLLLVVFACSPSAPDDTARVQPPVLVNDDLAPAAPTAAAVAGNGSGEARQMPGTSSTSTVCAPGAGEATGSGSCGGGGGCGHDCDQAAEGSGPMNCGGAAQDEMGAMQPPLENIDPTQIKAQPGVTIGDITTCLVSGEVFQVTERSAHVTHNGQEIYFCCRGCIRRFQRDPARYLGN